MDYNIFFMIIVILFMFKRLIKTILITYVKIGDSLKMCQPSNLM